jgi:hypothetical protein
MHSIQEKTTNFRFFVPTLYKYSFLMIFSTFFAAIHLSDAQYTIPACLYGQEGLHICNNSGIEREARAQKKSIG